MSDAVITRNTRINLGLMVGLLAATISLFGWIMSKDGEFHDRFESINVGIADMGKHQAVTASQVNTLVVQVHELAVSLEKTLAMGERIARIHALQEQVMHRLATLEAKVK